ncbi:MAG TPA: hypothetical protein VLC12_02505, partial [Terriglobales bacterium]|nr:hypothetical protein [Terriglobales bacterium]
MRSLLRGCRLPAAVCIALALALCAHAQNPSFPASVDRIAQQVLAGSGIPSASIAIVRDDQVVYAHAYGAARLDP